MTSKKSKKENKFKVGARVITTPLLYCRLEGTIVGIDKMDNYLIQLDKKILLKDIIESDKILVTKKEVEREL